MDSRDGHNLTSFYILRMCARFRSAKDLTLLAQLYGQMNLLNYAYNPNVAPTDEVPILTAEGLRLARFGMKMGPRQVLNARTDSIRNGSFKTGYAQKRCIIPAEGFYEWREENGKKQPYMFHLKDAPIMSLAGIWQAGEFKGEPTLTFAIVTDEPNEIIAPYHDRMPLAVADHETWLNVDKPLDTIQPVPSSEFEVRSMNPAMNKPSVKDTSLIEWAA